MIKFTAKDFRSIWDYCFASAISQSIAEQAAKKANDLLAKYLEENPAQLELFK